MQRSLRKAWKNKTPVGFTRRVQWYENDDSIRLQFIDEYGRADRIYYYADLLSEYRSEAESDMKRFVELCAELEKVMPAWPININNDFYAMSPTRLVVEAFDDRHAQVWSIESPSLGDGERK